ncbi:hypothetical protein ANANG_G00201600 [Anguilla anguilla]|uniref:G-protein coupled receptors family 1 profile domain-containing protein n=1 Tax=Anguilla anguilla TaxID=7936 RepID=A0A9D3M068_ANGAN|nr:hypothetical protein ANANG_G00201600 [Anguilla anguilla]
MPANLTGSNQTVPPNTDYNFPALVFGILLIIVIICGNLLVCLSVYTEKALKTTTNYFIVSLAVADLLLAVLVLPLFVYAEFQGGVWALSMFICDGLMTMDVMLCTASIFNLCAISIDRFIAVSIPLNYNRKHVDQRQVLLLSATWISALAVASPVIFGINNVPQRDPSTCKLEDDNYVVYSSVCSFFIPCPIMLLLYCGMFRGLRRWEEARKAKLRGGVQARTKLQRARDPADVRLDELARFPAGYKDGPIQTLAYPDRRYAHGHAHGHGHAHPHGHAHLKKKRAKINGRERKAMKVLPVVVGE